MGPDPIHTTRIQANNPIHLIVQPHHKDLEINTAKISFRKIHGLWLTVQLSQNEGSFLLYVLVLTLER